MPLSDGLDEGDGGPSNECDFGKGQVYACGTVKDGSLVSCTRGTSPRT